MKGLKVDAVLLTGGIHQYANVDNNVLTESLKLLGTSFDTQKNFMYLIPLPEHVDAMVNEGYYNTLRNQQLVSAMNENWTIINTMGVRESMSIQAYQNEMVDKLINELDN